MYQRKDGRWVAVLTLAAGGKQSLYAKTRVEARERLRIAQKAIDNGQPAKPSRVKVGPYLLVWLETTRDRVRPATWTNDRARVVNHIIPALGAVHLAELSPLDVERFLRERQASGLSAQTCVHLRGLLRRALKRALRDGLVARNAAQLADPPRLVRTRVPSFFDVAEALHFLEVVRGDRLQALWVMALTSGLRRGELLGLRWGDLDLDARTVRVTQALQRGQGRLQVVALKSAASARLGDLSSHAVAALRAHRDRLVTVPLPTAYVFTSTVGTPLEPRNVNRAFAVLLKNAKLRPIRLHDLRHSYGSLLLASGATAREVMELLGHSQISVTLNVYAHVLAESKRSAVDGLDRLLGGGVG